MISVYQKLTGEPCCWTETYLYNQELGWFQAYVLTAMSIIQGDNTYQRSKNINVLWMKNISMGFPLCKKVHV